MLRPDTRRLPLHVHISVMFTLLLLLTGSVLGVFNYFQTTQIILADSEKLFARIEQDVQLDLAHTYQPIRQALALLALVPAARAQPGQRLGLLEPFSQALTDNPTLAGLYIGDQDGSFFMVRPLRDALQRQHFQAPAQAAFELWTIERAGLSEPRGQSRFYDADLKLLSSRAIAKESYDPRQRAWFEQALAGGDQIATAPYVFFSSRQVGTTLARRIDGTRVIGADLTLVDLSAALAKHPITPSTQIALYDALGNAVAYPDASRLVIESGTAQLARLADLHPAFAQLLSTDHADAKRLYVDKRAWVIGRNAPEYGGPQGLRLALLVPEDELLSDAYRLRWQGALITLSILLLCLPAGWLTSRLLVKPLQALVNEADAVRSFDFHYPASKRSPVLEIDQLTLSMQRMRHTLASFFEITATLSAETRFAPLLQRVLQETVAIGQAQAGIIYLYQPESDQVLPSGLIINQQKHAVEPFHLMPHTLAAAATPEWLRSLAGEDHLLSNIGYENAGELKHIMLELDTPRVDLIGIRLRNRRNETIGMLIMLHRDTGAAVELRKFAPDRIAFLQAVSGVAAASIDGQRLQVRQRELLDAFIQIIAGAIDAKSPYTGGHCQRVPELTLMIAEAAAASDAAPLRDYQPDDDAWETLHIAAWLHDCGKVTTPEYVVDKATKLETLYDRIHEVRMRFEVLKRDAWIAYWQGRCEGHDATTLAAVRDAQLATLDQDFAFIAQCNLGGETLDDASRERLARIGGQTWLRTLDDRLGVSWEENRRQQRTHAPTLPVLEALLADKPEHLFDRDPGERIGTDHPLGFNLKEPKHKFNRGELYNLGIARGTLTAEERYIINHHMVQTLIMLNRLPFPQHLGNVAEIAGGHHEKMDGTGYPRGLTREQMSLPARMMAIADIFEALTAADRPYKKGKTLSEALNIMANMCREAHIDPDLFQLFIEQGIYQQYAERFLPASQVDSVDMAALMVKAGLGPSAGL